MGRTSKFGVLAIGVGLILGAACLATSITVIEPGYRGVVYNRNGGVDNETVGQGWNLVSPLKKVIPYPVSTETASYSATSEEADGDFQSAPLVLGTKDGKTVKVDMQLFYHMNPDKLGNVFNKFRGKKADEIAYGYMRQNTQRIVNDISSKYTIVDLVGEEKPKFNAEVFTALTSFFEEDGIVIEEAGLGRVEPDEATQARIQAVADAQYRQKQAEYEKQVAEVEAEKKRVEAQGEADALKIRADSEAYYNNKIAESASEKVVKLEAIKKWDGQLPQYQLGNSDMLLNIR